MESLEVKWLYDVLVGTPKFAAIVDEEGYIICQPMDLEVAKHIVSLHNASIS